MHSPALDAFKKSGEFELARPHALATVTPSRAASAKPQSQSGKRSWKTAVAVSLALATAVAAVGVYQPWKSLPSVAAVAASEAEIASKTVNVDRPSPASTASVVLPATFRPWQTTSLHARVSGYLKAWHQDLGAGVQAGDLLAEIETPELDQELLEIHPLRRRRRARETETADLVVQRAQSAGRMVLAQVTAPSTDDGAADRESHIASPIRNQSEEAHCSTNKLQASGKN